MTGTLANETEPGQLPPLIDVAFVERCYPDMKGVSFLDHAAASPLPRPSIDAMIAMTKRLGRPDYPDALMIADRLRRRIAQLVNSDPRSVALTRSTAHGISILSQSLAFASGDNVVVVDGDYPTAIYPWLACEQQGLTVRFVKPHGQAITPEKVLELVDSNTKVVCLSGVMFVSGYRLDLATIGAECRRLGVLFCVDGMQSVGAFEVDTQANHIDLLSSGTVKWLLGPGGISFCSIRPDLIEQLPPLIPGALTVKNPLNFTTYDPTWAPDAHRFEETWLPVAEMAALEVSLAIAMKVGASEIESRIIEHGRSLAEALLGLGAELCGPWPRSESEQSSIVSFKHPSASSERIADTLVQANVRFSQRGEYIRLSPHYYTSQETIDTALDAIESALNRRS